MTRNQLTEQIKSKKSFLCVGLDTDPEKIPSHLLRTDDPMFEFNRAIIDATKEYVVAYKPNLAFYEAQGVSGWKSLEKTVDYCRQNCQDIFLIADAKRGDIGNTSKMYAQAFFSRLPFDAVTVAPYMGADSVTPFLGFEGKWVILLALTSNAGASDFQYFGKSDWPLFKEVIRKSGEWAGSDTLMFVVGATKAAMLKEVRSVAPDHFLLVPGVGAQGGSLKEVAVHGLTKDCGLLVNASRSVIYAGNEEDFASKARSEAQKLQQEMAIYLDSYCFK